MARCRCREGPRTIRPSAARRTVVRRPTRLLGRRAWIAAPLVSRIMLRPAPNIPAPASNPVMNTRNVERLPWTAPGRPSAGRTISLVLAAALALAIALVVAAPLVAAS